MNHTPPLRTKADDQYRAIIADLAEQVRELKAENERLARIERCVNEFLHYSEKARSDPDTLRHLLRKP